MAATLPTGDEQAIRERVLRGLALNREPGFHFAGNFLDVSFDHVSRAASRLSLEPGLHCVDADGQVDLGSFAMLADLALAATVRANLERAQRLATVSMNLELTGVPRTGRLEAAGEFHGFFSEGSGRLGQSRVVVTGGAGEVAFGSGSFMALRPPAGVTMHPAPNRRRDDAPPPQLAATGLKRDELEILQRADAALARVAADGSAFVRRFWGYAPRRVAGGAAAAMKNGPHIGNRVGHAQGGIQLGLAAVTASAALPATWALTGISGWYISPGEGASLRARSEIVHHGRLTAVVRTEVTGKERRRVLEVVTTHACRPAQER
jgi:acyl-coenzyme A thioesterase PaaI-like protein